MRKVVSGMMEIKTQDLSLTYPNGKKALGNFTVNMNQPGMIGLVGPNGAGKSTLMKLLVGGLLPTSGSILVDGKPLASVEKRLKAGLGYLPQSFGLYDELSVWQFLDYMASLKGIDRDKKGHVEAALLHTNLAGLRKSRIATLSGGQRQRVGIAQALLGSPELLIFDEPTVGLDPEERINIRNLFSRTAQDRTVILSTHIIEDVQSVCSRLLVVLGGRLRFDGSPEALITMAEGHVGVMESDESDSENGYRVTARVNTARGVISRIVAHQLPAHASTAEPTLEDAYMYLMDREERAV